MKPHVSRNGTFLARFEAGGHLRESNAFVQVQTFTPPAALACDARRASVGRGGKR